MHSAQSMERNEIYEGSADQGRKQKRPVLREETAEILRQALRDNRSYLMENESKEILESIGVATTGYLVARSEDEAIESSLSENKIQHAPV